MKIQKNKAKNDKEIHKTQEVIEVSTDIEIIEPINDVEIQYIEDEFQDCLEKNEYNHLAHSQF